jgi:hypothetical protein
MNIPWEIEIRHFNGRRIASQLRPLHGKLRFSPRKALPCLGKMQTLPGARAAASPRLASNHAISETGIEVGKISR